jgi:hypothetical protein
MRTVPSLRVTPTTLAPFDVIAVTGIRLTPAPASSTTRTEITFAPGSVPVLEPHAAISADTDRKISFRIRPPPLAIKEYIGWKEFRVFYHRNHPRGTVLSVVSVVKTQEDTARGDGNA